MKKKGTVILRILLSAVFSAALIASVLSITVSLCFSLHTVTRRLEKQGFSDFALSEIAKNMEDFQSVIGVPTETLLAAIPTDDIQKTLYRYTDGVNRLLLAGEKTDLSVSFSTDALKELIESEITPDHYKGNLKQMEKDRAEAISEITAAVQGTLSFFPTTLFDKMTALITKSSGFSTKTVYDAVRYIRYAVFPSLLLLLCSAVLLVFMKWEQKRTALRALAGKWFITASVLFLPTFFLTGNTPLNRLSISDCLLRRYILALGAHMQSCILTVSLVFFLIGLVFLLFTLYLSAKNAQSPCTEPENVIK